MTTHDNGAYVKLTGEQLLEALDLTCQPDGIPELVIVQDHFWAAKREWEAKKAAYELVVSDIVERQTNAR